MSAITLPPHSPGSTVRRMVAPRVYVNGTRRRNLTADAVEHLPGPEFGSATIVLARSPHALRLARIEEADHLPPVGSVVEVRNPVVSADWSFPGVVVRHEARIDAKGNERLLAVAQHRLATLTRQRITGQILHDGRTAVTLTAERTRFNAGEGTCATAEIHSVNGRSCRLFAADANGIRWSVADALAYLLATAVSRDVDAAGLAELGWHAGQVDLGSLDVTGDTAGEAIVKVASRAGLGVRASTEGLAVVVQPRGVGRPIEVKLQRPGAALSTARSNLWQARVQFDRRPGRPGVLATGDYRCYESTFELSPGWDPSAVPGRWADTRRADRGDWHNAADLLRRWVLNEDGAYSPPPYLLPRYAFPNLPGEDFALARRRRFLPCLSADVRGRSLGVVVELSYDAGDTWRRWTGPVWTLAERCGVRLGGDALAGDYFRAVSEGTARLRVTATVAGDLRVSADVAGDPGAGREVLSLGSRAQWKQVSETSVFNVAEGLGTPAERDDTPLLISLAEARQVALAAGVGGELTLPWVEPTLTVGDVVAEIGGRGLDLRAVPTRAPAVVRARHEFADSQQTLLTVE